MNGVVGINDQYPSTLSPFFYFYFSIVDLTRWSYKFVRLQYKDACIDYIS